MHYDLRDLRDLRDLGGLGRGLREEALVDDIVRSASVAARSSGKGFAPLVQISSDIPVGR